MALHGSVGEFDPVKEEWSTYSSRLEYYFEANRVEDPDRKRAILLSVSGIETFKLVTHLTSPNSPKDYSFQEIVDLISEHYNPKKSQAVHRFKFNSRTRHQGETVSAYIAELKKLAIPCEFNGEAELKKMLCDRLICGINDARMQHRLLAEPELDYDRAFKLVQASESADKSTQEMDKAAAANTSAGIHRMSQPSKKPESHGTEPTESSCYRCGGKHRANVCRFRTADCRYCGKKGHIARVCRSRLRAASSTKKTPSTKPPPSAHRTNHISDESDLPAETTSSSTAEYSMFQLSAERVDPITISVQANSKDLTMELDTGAALSVISESTYLSTWSPTERPPLKPSNATLTTYSGESLEVCGAITVPVTYKQQSNLLSLQVLKKEGPSLLGRDWLKHLVLDWKQINFIRQQSNPALQKLPRGFPRRAWLNRWSQGAVTSQARC